MFIWAAPSEKVSLNIHVRWMRRIRFIPRMRKVSQAGICSPLIRSIVSINSFSEQQRPWSECVVPFVKNFTEFNIIRHVINFKPKLCLVREWRYKFYLTEILLDKFISHLLKVIEFVQSYQEKNSGKWKSKRIAFGIKEHTKSWKSETRFDWVSSYATL